MAPFFLFYFFLLPMWCAEGSSAPSPSFAAAAVTLASKEMPVLAFDEGYTKVFGHDNLMLLHDGKTVHISLDRKSGSGFASQDLYLHGLFSASIKLPSDYAAGVVVAFYMSNGDVFEDTHDELDFEFLGNIRGKEWRVQTNVYGNGTARGREERYGLWFDPTEDFHQYSILWSNETIIFSIDETPVREITRSPAMGGGDFPAKPMSLYATIWDGSGWATSGGRYKVNYKYAPYVAQFADLILHGCAVDPSDHSPTCERSRSFSTFALSGGQRAAMEQFRKAHVAYSYCYDRERYRAPPQECAVDPAGANRLHGVRFDRSGFRRRHGKRRGGRSPPPPPPRAELGAAQAY